MRDEALKLALEALENGKRVRNAEGGTKYQPDLEDNAIDACKQALAAQRQWVGLSQDELDAMFSNTIKGKKLVNYVARAIEAKLKEKNT
jgi:hypothetical protein